MSHSMTHPHTPDDPKARALIQAYEDTVATEGPAAAYNKHFADDCFYVFYGKSALAGRYEGKAGLKRFWDTLMELADVDVEPVTELAGDGICTYIARASFTNRSGESLETRITGMYETLDGKILNGRFFVMDQDAFDKLFP